MKKNQSANGKTSVTRKIPKWAASPQTWQRVEKGRTYHRHVSPHL